MKRKLTFLDKIKVFKNWMKQYGNMGLIEHCQYCKSMKVKINNSWENDNCYGAEYECTDCGARATTHEQWKKGK